MARRLINSPNTTDQNGPLKEILLKLAISDPKNVSKYTGLVDLMDKVNPPKETSADEIKTALAKQNANQIISQLEDLYYKGTSGTGSYEKPKLAYGRLGGLIEGIKAKSLGSNPDVLSYENILATIRPTLVKAAGDVGNLSETEQKAAIKSLPKIINTAEEARQLFAETRKRFGLSESPYKIGKATGTTGIPGIPKLPSSFKPSVSY